MPTCIPRKTKWIGSNYIWYANFCLEFCKCIHLEGQPALLQLHIMKWWWIMMTCLLSSHPLTNLHCNKTHKAETYLHLLNSTHQHRKFSLQTLVKGFWNFLSFKIDSRFCHFPFWMSLANLFLKFVSYS